MLYRALFWLVLRRLPAETAHRLGTALLGALMWLPGMKPLWRRLAGARDPRLRPSERLSMIRSVLGTQETRDMGYVWMKDHLAELMDGAGGIFFTTRLPGMVGGFCSVEKAADIARTLGPTMAGKTAELEFERTVERVRSCGVLKEARAAEVNAALIGLNGAGLKAD